MRPSITLGLILCIALSASTLACHDSLPAAPEQALDNHTGSSGGDGGGEEGSDSTSTTPDPPNRHEPVEPASPPDSVVQTPPPPVPGTFALYATVFGAEAATDTTRTVRLPGVTVSLYRVRNGDGSAVQPEVLVGTGVTDARGDFIFHDLASAYYRLDVKAPPGGPYLDASRSITPPSVGGPGMDVVLVMPVVLQRKG
ncbi:MAG: hypothetical protein ABR499_15250 [Gemmatimonadaceae bacterium]